MKKSLKKGLALILAICLTVPAVSSMSGSVNTVQASSSGDAAENSVTGVKYVYYEDISQYRGEKSGERYTEYPMKEGFVFAGWYDKDAFTAGETAATDKEKTTIETTAVNGAAWAKFVPEEVLSVKAQTSSSVADKPESVKLRLVTTVDSNRYSEVGFKIKYDQGNKVYTYSSNEVFSKLTAYEKGDRAFVYQPRVFHEASLYFMAYTILDVNQSRFDNFEFHVTPYWVTKDGTLVTGIARERLLASDDRSSDEDGTAPRFFVKSTENTFNTVDSNLGTISVTTTDSAVHAIYFGADESGLESSYWRVTGKYSATGGGVGFSIKSGDHLEGYTFGGGTTVHVNQQWGYPHEGANWNDYTDSAGEYITEYNSGLNAWNTATDVPFCAELKDDVLTLWVNGNKAWNLPLTDDGFGGFEAGSAYSFGFHNIDANHTITWSDIKVETEDSVWDFSDKKTYQFPEVDTDVADFNRFYVKSGAESFNTVDSSVGMISVTTTETDTAVHAVYFGTDESGLESSYWRVTGKYSATGGGVGFSIKSGDHMEGYTFGGGTTVHVNQQWGYPNEGTAWNDYTDSTGEYITEYNSGLNGWNTATDVPFCAEIKDDVLTLWVNGNKAWNLPLTDDRFGGFEVGSTYSFGFHNIDPNHTITWSDLMIETTEDTRFSIKEKTDGVTTYEQNGIIVSESGENILAKSYLSADAANGESDYWNVTGKYTANQGMKGFSIKSGDHEEGYTLTGETSICLNQSWNYPNATYEVTGDGWNVYNDTTGKHITSYNVDFGGVQGANEIPFRAEIKNDVFTVWVNDNKAWELPLTDERFGGFKAGSTYSLGFHNIDADCIAKWTNLVVSTEAPTYTVDYTYNIGTNERISYRYISGASDTVYAAGIYTKKSSNDVFGLAIRNGGQERQVFFDGHGVRILNADGAVSNYTTPIINDNGAYVWYQDKIDGTSAVADMLAQESGDIQIAWAIENNYLYCNVNEATAFRIPMTALCADWQDGRYYQVGIAACGENSEGLKFKLTDWAFGKDVYTNRYMTAETDKLQVNGMVYDPIGKGAYVSTYENQVVYANTKTYMNTSESVIPLAIEATLDWQAIDKEYKWDNTTVGVTVVLDGNNEKSVQFDIVSDEYVRLNSGYSGWNYRGSDNSLWIKGDGNDLIKAPISSNMKIQAAVYDHVFYIMFNGVTAYECALTDLFGGVVGANSLYDGTQKVDIGIVSAYNDRRTPKFKDVNVYEGQAAVEMKTKEWDFYPTKRGGDELIGSYDVTSGTITNENYYSVNFGTSSEAWEITGTWYSPAAGTWNTIGFVVTDESGNCLRIMASNNCIQVDTVGSSWTDALVYYDSNSNYVKNGSIFTDNFLQKVGTLELKMRLVNNQMDIYLDNTLCYTIPLQELNTNLEKGRYKVATAGWDGDNQWQNVKVKKGCEVTGEFSTFAEQVLATTELATIKIRDPYILTDESKGYYYMYGTDTAGFSANDGGVPVYRSKNMQNWERLAPCYIADLTKYTQYSLWAPEVIKYNDSYYMTLTVLEQGEMAADAGLSMTYSNPQVRKTIILKSDRPTGGFEIIADNVTLPGHDCLDGTLYFEGGTPYLIYSHEWCCNACFGDTDEAAASNTNRMGHMNYVKLKADLSGVADDGVHVKWCTASDYVVEDANASIWDKIFGTVETNAACVVDGPQVYEKDGQKYLLWSTGTASAEAIDSTYYAQLYVPFDSLNGGVELKNSQTLYTGDDSNTAFANNTGGGHGMIFCDISTKDEKYVLHAPNVSTDSLFEHAVIFGVEFNNDTKTITKK